MGLKDIPFLSGFFDQDPVRSSMSLETAIFKLSTNITYKEYAMQIAINKLASALTLCRFDTFENGELKKDHYWWRFNFEPNLNTNAHDFFYQIIYEMVHNEDGALVVQTDDGYLVVAEDYEVIEHSLYENIYGNVQLYGGFQYERSFIESEILRFQFPSKRVKRIVSGIFEDYSKLIQVTSNAYMRERSMKFKLKIGTTFDQRFGEDMEERDNFLDEMFTNRFKSIFEPSDTITPLEEGLDLESMDESRASTVSAQVKATEITQLFDEAINATADAFAIPRGLLKGDVADVEAMTDNFIEFAVRPLAKEISTEINRKLYKKEKVTAGTKIKINTSTIKTNNIVSFAAAADKLISASVATPNEMRAELDWERVDNPLLDEFKQTKNYSRLEQGESNDMDKGS